ncbi:hypothetical protein [Vagococcus sp.]|uniref:hypothetical protein n=1 Tax=Vagococcus sp. TaxID=1933889 RepID=UPI003F9A14BD
MTQENKLEMIDYLTKELVAEAEKQGFSLVLAVNLEEDVIMTGSMGNPVELFECISTLEEEFEDRTGMDFDNFKKTINDECDCSGCKARRGEDNSGDIPDGTFASFLTALLRMSEEGVLDD